MRVRDQHQVDGRQIAKIHTRLLKPLQHEQPACEVGINNYILATRLDEETGVADESHSQFSIAYQFWFVSFSRARSNRRVMHQTPEGAGTLAKDGVLETGL